MLDFGFYNMDCLEGMRQFPDGYFGLAIVDPPYGINIGHAVRGGAGGNNIFDRDKGVKRPFGGKKQQITGGGTPARQNINVYGKSRSALAEQKFYHAFDDRSPPDAAYFRELMRVSKNQIIWGGNYFLDFLSATPCLLIWDKKRRGMTQADCEIAWTSFKGQSRIIDFRWNGMLQGDMKNKEERIHPTQKPVELYKWIINLFAEPDDIILDTHVGSASSLIACRNTGHKYVGFEIDETYYKLAKERLDAAEAQQNIFDYMKPQARQMTLFDEEVCDDSCKR